jgi:hypothetical protein
MSSSARPSSADLVENLADAAKLLRQNGQEETAHAERMRLISKRLAG